MRRIAVTGATGFIGRHLVARLAANGDDVRAIVRPGSRALDRIALAPGVRVVRAALDAASLREPFSDVDTVVHLAGVVSSVRERTFYEVNVEGTRAVATTTLAAGAHLVNISSLAAAGPAAPSAPRAEDDLPAPITAYGRSKLEGERLISNMAGLRWTVLRPAIVYGPGDRALFPIFQAALRGVLPLVGRSGSGYTIVHVSDLVAAIAAAIDRGPTGNAIFVGHPRPTSARRLTEAVRDAVGHPAVMIPIPMSVLRVLAWGGDVAGALTGRPLPIDSRRYAEVAADGFVCRVDRLRERLGVVAAIDLAQGLAETAAWYREVGWLRRM